MNEDERKARCAAGVNRIVNNWRRCKGCELWKTRTYTVHWRGDPSARIALVGEAPGGDEDVTGIPFKGKAGRELDSMLLAVGLDRFKDVFVCNVLACRPPGNRNPLPEEAAACRSRLTGMLAAVDPKVVVMLGAQAGGHLGGFGTVRQWRGRLLPVEFLHRSDIIRTTGVVTYHPAYVCRNPLARNKVEDDLRLAKEFADG